MKSKYSYTAIIVFSLLILATRPVLGTWHIPLDPDIGMWNPVTRTYTLTTDVYETIGNAIEIDEDNLTLDGDGHIVTGPEWGGNGIYLRGRSEVTVKNLTVEGFTNGILLEVSTGNTLTGNAISNNRNAGIYLHTSDNNTLTTNTTSNSYYGIYLMYSRSNILAANTSSALRSAGISLANSSNNFLAGNVVTNNPSSNGIILMTWSENNILTGNTVSGNNYYGIVVGARRNILAGNTVSRTNRYGIYLASRYNTLICNTLSDNRWYGIYLYFSHYNQIYNNNFIGNGTNAFSWGVNYSGNTYNLERPIGGNYWDDWTSPDMDSDGIVDNPYEPWGNIKDNLPWTEINGWPNHPPVADAGPDQTVLVNEKVIFEGRRSYDPDGTLVCHVWDFGDGSPTTPEAVISHTYAAAGSYVAILVTMDADGASATDQTTITVQTPAEACEGLIATVKSMNLQQGLENSFDVKLEAVQDALVAANAGDREDVVNKLEAFINAVEAQRGKVLTDEQTNLLVNYANRIIATLG